MQAFRLRCEHLENPLGLDQLNPRLSWALRSSVAAVRQASYRIRVSSSVELAQAQHGDLWDSGVVASDRSLLVPYSGAPLESRQRCYWTVQATDQQGNSLCSEIAWWEMGLLDSREWVGEWISGPIAPPSGTLPAGSHNPHGDAGRFSPGLGAGPVYCLARKFELSAVPARARIYAAALGLYRLYLNGEPLDERVFAPGWTDYSRRVEYQVYDVTALLRSGQNALCAVLADGWYAGYVGFGAKTRGAFYGARPQFLCQLEVGEHAASRVVLRSDRSWQTGFASLHYSDLLMGELCDRRNSNDHWLRADVGAGTAYAPTLGRPVAAQLVAERGPPMRGIDELAPVSIVTSAQGHQIVDFGQNIAGRVRLTVNGQRGTRVTLRHAEALAADGTLYTENLRNARAEDILVLAGDGPEHYEPTFTMHGFRYVEVSGIQSPIDAQDIVAIPVMSATVRVGHFVSGHPLVNRIYSNALWSQRGNFLSIPSDCPQRDERLGWLGDAQVFARTASYNMDVAGFFTKWLHDVLDAQRSDGAFTDVAPLVIFDNGAAPGWGEAGLIIPWTLLKVYGDTGAVDVAWAAMERFFSYLGEGNADGIRRCGLNLNFGDWLNVDDDTPRELVASAFYARAAWLMADMARDTGRSVEAARYEQEFERIRAAYCREFIAADGSVSGHTQAGYVLTLAFDLVPQIQKPETFGHLVECLEAKALHSTCGFLSINALLPVLSEHGRSDIAYRVLLQTTYPSWGFCIDHGATTIWERWDSWTPETGFQRDMNSFNHYAFGSVVEWLYRYCAGIDLTSDGLRAGCFRIQPRPSFELGRCEATFESSIGPVRSAWNISLDRIDFAIDLPANSRAVFELRMPPVTSGDCRAVELAPEILHLESGSHRFSRDLPNATATESA